MGILRLNKLIKENFVKMYNCDTHIKRGRQISNEYENIISDEMVSIFNQSVVLGKAQVFEFEDLNDVFINNQRYPDFLLKKSNAYNKIANYVDYF